MPAGKRWLEPWTGPLCLGGNNIFCPRSHFYHLVFLKTPTKEEKLTGQLANNSFLVPKGQLPVWSWSLDVLLSLRFPVSSSFEGNDIRRSSWKPGLLRWKREELFIWIVLVSWIVCPLKDFWAQIYAESTASEGRANRRRCLLSWQRSLSTF